MGELNFLPSCCKEKKERQWKGKHKRYIFLILIPTTFFLLQDLSSIMKKNSLQKEIEVVQERNSSVHEEKNEKRWSTIKSFEYFAKNIGCKEDYKSVMIKENHIEFEVYYKSRQEYYDIIKNIESIKNFKVENISNLAGENEKKWFQISIEVKE